MMKYARVATALLLLATPVWAEDTKPDDRVTFVLSAESWATTASARVTVTVDAAVAGTASGSMRADMQKAVNSVAKADWRVINFSREQDQTGLERWNASFEARIPENELGGLRDAAKKASKAGMQLTIAEIAFDPTLAEMEAVRAKLRTDLYKQANDQLAALNAAIPNRQYRISAMDFGRAGNMPLMAPRPMIAAMKASSMSGAGNADAEMADPSMERAEKVTQHVQVTFAALPPTPTTGK